MSRRRAVIAAGSGVAALAIAAAAVAQSASGWEVSLPNFGGGGTSTGTGGGVTYTVQGAIGQPFTGTVSKDQFAISTGIFGGALEKILRYLPFVAKDGTN